MTALAPCWLLPGWAWSVVLAVVAVTLVMVWRFHRRLGGYTGDCLGAVQQVTEVVVLLVGVAWR